MIMRQVRRLTVLIAAFVLSIAASGWCDAWAQEDRIVIVWSHGSCGADDQSDQDQGCARNPPPEFLKRLETQGLDGQTVRLDVVKDRAQAGDYASPHWKGEPKACARANSLAAYIEREYRGQPRQTIFLAGVSAGAWASLLVKRRYPGNVNGVIAFSPAAHHQRRDRAGVTEDLPPEFAQRWQEMRSKNILYLDSVGAVAEGGPSALLLQSHCDSFEWPQDLAFTSPEYRRHLYPALAGGTMLECCQIKSVANGFQICRSKPDAATSGPCCTDRTIGNCPAGMSGVCNVNAHVKLHLTAAFERRYAQTVRDFIIDRVEHAQLPAAEAVDGTACAFLAEQ